MRNIDTICALRSNNSVMAISLVSKVDLPNIESDVIMLSKHELIQNGNIGKQDFSMHYYWSSRSSALGKAGRKLQRNHARHGI